MSRQSPDRRSGGAYFPLPKLFNREPKKEARPHRPAPSLLLHFGVPFFVPCRFRLPCLRHALFPDCHNDALYNQEQTQKQYNDFWGAYFAQEKEVYKDILSNHGTVVSGTVEELAEKYKYTVCMGRTHGIHAEPTTFGLKAARWYSEMKRNIERFDRAAKGVEAGKISGAVGTYANIDPFVEEYVCEKLGIRAQEVSSQVLPRDLHADYMASLALIATSLEEFATEIRGLQKSETREVEEYFAKGQKGSSAMPHKRNPIGSENICGLARVCRGHMVTAYENVALWHERDISHSSAERIILPDTTILIDYMLNRFGRIVKNLTVFPENMKRNMDKTFGLIYSGRVLLKLIDTGMSREEAYDLVQPYTAKAWDEQTQFRPLLESDATIMSRLSKEDLDDAFDYHWHLKHIDDIFKRVGLE